jgi:2',3'-cyclic-nucleotide 2'-phosphodiesterase (5'-nucleotidase family)
LARRATAIKIERQARDHVLLMDAGNSILGFGSDYESKAGMMFEAMNRMGYDALTIGPGELRMGSELLLSLMAQADFPFLSANLTQGKDGPPLVQPYTIRRLDGHRVAIIGVTAPEATDIHQLEEGEVGVLDPIESVRRQVKAIKGQTEVVIVLSYLGLQMDQQLAQEVKGIDLIVGGRSGDSLEEPLRNEATGTLIVQARKKGEWLGIIDLELDQRGRIVSYGSRNVVLDRDVADDADFTAWFRTVRPTPTPDPEREI